MTSNEYIKEANGDLRCDMCGFVTVHVFRMQSHMVKSHGHGPYPEPPLLAEKWAGKEVPGTKKVTKKVTKKEVKDGSNDAD